MQFVMTVSIRSWNTCKKLIVTVGVEKVDMPTLLWRWNDEA